MYYTCDGAFLFYFHILSYYHEVFYFGSVNQETSERGYFTILSVLSGAGGGRGGALV